MSATVRERHGAAAKALPRGSFIIGGGHVESGSAGMIKHINPSTGLPQADVPMAGATEVDEAVRAARAALPEWRGMNPARRRDLIIKLSDLIARESDALGDITALETGTPKAVFVNGFLAIARNWFHYFAGWADKLEGAVVGSGTAGNFDFNLYEPYGVIALIIPFNAPMLSLCMKVPPALAAGNTLVIKPAETAPFATIRFAELALEAGFPEGVINVIIGDGRAGQALIEHPGVDKLSFTGGLETAKRIMRTAAERMLPGLYELGGKSANVVFADAPDLYATAEYCAMFPFTNAGQGCACPTRLLVEAGIYDEFLDRVTGMVDSIKIGDPLSPDTYMGPVITQASMERIFGMIGRANARNPGKLVRGGSRLGGDYANGFFVEPTIFADVDPESEIVQREVFGPVLSILKFRDEAEALALANSTEYGLASYVQTADIDRAFRFVDGLRAGAVLVNRTFPMSNPAAVIGGWGLSGFGREGGRPGIDEFMRMKAVSISRGRTL